MRLIYSILLLFAVPSARAIATYGTGDPTHNTTAPSGPFANSGWEKSGQWGVFMGWPIGPNHFLTSDHIGGSVGGQLIVNGVPYTTTAMTSAIPALSVDIRLWTISGSFPNWAKIFTNTSPNELGRAVMMIGRGTDRSSTPFSFSCSGTPTVGGWEWGANNHVQRWGTNVVTLVGSGFIGMIWDRSLGNDVGQISAGDSSGGCFVIDDDGIWKLDGLWATNGGGFDDFVYLEGCSPDFRSTSITASVREIYSWIVSNTGPIPDPPATTLGVHVEAAKISGLRISP